MTSENDNHYTMRDPADTVPQVDSRWNEEHRRIKARDFIIFMTSIEKLCKAIRDAQSKEVKRYITHEIINSFARVPAVSLRLLSELLVLSESPCWEDRVSGASILQEMVRASSLPDAFKQGAPRLQIDIKGILRSPTYLASFYDVTQAAPRGGEDLDLEDHNVVLKLSNIKIPGAAKRKENTLKRKKARDRDGEKEKKTIGAADEFYAQMITNLSSYTWEVRHGAAQSIYGMLRGMQEREKHAPVARTLNAEDYILPLFSTLALDRFNDYETDVAVSPVREISAKALEQIFPFVSVETVKTVVAALAELCTETDWQIKYSGLIGIKYAQPLITPEIMPQIVQRVGGLCIELLGDLDEDVKGIAAQILAGIIENFEQSPELLAEHLDIGQVVEMCWETLEEEEDLAAAKAKIMHLLEKLHALGHSLKEMDMKRYMAVLQLLRSPIDSVRLSVLSLLRSAPVMAEEATLHSLLFSVMAEEEQEVRGETEKILAQLSQGAKDGPSISSMVGFFLRLVCSAYTKGSIPEDKLRLIVVGEADICHTEDGCKMLGEERVVQGRVCVYNALLECALFLPHLLGYFARSTPELPYFSFFRAITISRLAHTSGATGTKSTTTTTTTGTTTSNTTPTTTTIVDLIDNLRQLHGDAAAEDESRNETGRSGYALLRMLEGQGRPEDASILLRIYASHTPSALLRVLSGVCASPELGPLLSLAVDAVCHRDREMEKEKEEAEREVQKLEKEKQPGRKPRALRDVQEEAEPWKLLILFETLGEAFLDTATFDALRSAPEKCVVFLKHTIHLFGNASRLAFIFDHALSSRSAAVVRYLIQNLQGCNEKYITYAVEKLGDASSGREEDASPFLQLLTQTVSASAPPLLVPLVFPLVEMMNANSGGSGARELASRAFAEVVPSMYLREPARCSSSLLAQQIESSRKRIDSLLRSDDIESQVRTDLVLREYQKQGVEWIHFLNKTGVGGMLCDDMGLGKTIQVLFYLAYKQQHVPPESFAVLVLCPSAITGHWICEVSTYFPTLSVATIQDFTGRGICVSSYDKFRVSSEQFSKRHWLYLVLDEGHIIKNANTLLHARVKGLKATHRLLLSGTPIQNSVGELWSLFDIIMPGYLGTDKEFGRNYLRPILRGREGKGTAHDAEVAKQKLDALHRVVLPFMLRRMKESVLSDLPPKIIRDLRVSMCPAQKELYESVAAAGEVSGSYGETTSASNNFTHLMRLVKTCSHPALLGQADIALAGLSHKYSAKSLQDFPSGKVSALLELLSVILPSSKVLIFCQYKASIGVLAKYIDTAHPGVQYCRLDGDVKGSERAALAQKFNSSPEIGIMLATTHAGGLGLNLTGAEAVIFFEHDWNPMIDLQAMDRAHRIGQKKSVSVFRLVTRDSIEESIMSLQNFKTYISGAVVNQQNVDIESMDREYVLERLQKKKEQAPAPPAEREEEYGDFI